MLGMFILKTHGSRIIVHHNVIVQTGQHSHAEHQGRQVLAAYRNKIGGRIEKKMDPNDEIYSIHKD